MNLTLTGNPVTRRLLLLGSLFFVATLAWHSLPITFVPIWKIVRAPFLSGTSLDYYYRYRPAEKDLERVYQPEKVSGLVVFRDSLELTGFLTPEVMDRIRATNLARQKARQELIAWQQRQIAAFSVIHRIESAPGPAQVEEWFQKYGGEFGVDPIKLRNIARCESNFHPDSVNAGGPYLGMYQYLESTWVATRTDMGEDPDPALVFNAQEAIKTSAWKIAHGGIDAWPVCGKL